MEDAQFFSELYEVIASQSDGEYENIISEKASYPYLYHLSAIRQNLVDWIPMNRDMRVLECNPECGALTGKPLEKAGKVTCVAQDTQHAKIIEARYKDAGERLSILMENDDITEESAKYDVIFIVGSFYRYKDELARLYKLLKPEGRLIVADANRLGLRYFAGCREEYGGKYFAGVEGYADREEDATKARCYSKSEYTKYLSDAGFGNLKFYYPFPDYKFPNCVYSEQWLPQEGELSDNRRNFDSDRLQLFDERKVYDTLIKEGLFESFSNSYLIEAYR